MPASGRGGVRPRLNPGAYVAKEKNPVQAKVEKACKEHRVKINKCVDKTDWLWVRVDALTGTDMAGILGLSPWISAGEVLRRKQVQDTDLELPSTEAMEWGIRLEKVVLQAYKEKTNQEVWAPAPYTFFMQKGERVEDYIGIDEDDLPIRPLTPEDIDHVSILGGTPDAFGMMENGDIFGIEIKTSSSGEGWKTPPEDSEGILTYATNGSIPIHYYVQVQTYMAFMPFIPHFDVVVLIAGNKMRIYHIKRDEDMISTIRNFGLQMYGQYLWERQEIPGVMFEKNVGDCERAWPYSKSDTSLGLESSDRAVIAAEAYFYVNKYISFLEGLKTNLRGIIVARMKEAEAIASDTVKVSYKTSGTVQFKTDHLKKYELAMRLMKEYYPKAYEELTQRINAFSLSYVERIRPSRRFLVTIPREKRKTISTEVINGQLQKLGESHLGNALPAIGVDEEEV
jgi:predicted phage-related endonuclease